MARSTNEWGRKKLALARIEETSARTAARKPAALATTTVMPARRKAP